ncbi:VNX1-like protein [Mya arenaria]|uniref:VNX1-like protein n=1 Tax=Mya arenaria TaxID=6604 RepID=A0ABY7DMR7_MYAAR|nr:VNX1-like protein [Mya arenaria]
MDDDGKITDSRQPSHEHNLHESPSHHHHHHISHVRDNQHASTAKHHSSHTASMDVMPPNGELRRRSAVDKYEQSGTHSLTESIPEGDFEVITPENAIEAHRMFGFKKWKSHVTARPLSERSNVVQDLYADIAAAKPVRVSTLRPTNVLYIVFVGWWMFLIYLLMALLMTISVIGYPYASYCIKMGTFFLWPFGKFSHKSVPITTVESHQFEVSTENMHEGTSLITPTIKHRQPICSRNFWVNLKMVSYVMWLPPDQVSIGDSGFTSMSINIYYYKYTIDGMNIILVNLLVFVLLSIAIGYFDVDADGATSSFAIGAVLNATFGSLVELILYIVSLQKGKRSDGTFDPCYAELVKSGLAGTLIGCVLLIPGICMIVGGVFAPTLFSKIFGDLQCDKCEVNVTNRANLTEGLQCTGCSQSIAGLDGDDTLFNKHIQPLVYAVALILPITYITGVVFTLKTHTSYVYDDFYQQLIEEDNSPDLVEAEEHRDSHGLCHADCSYFIGVTMIAMIPELPEIVNGIQFALQNNPFNFVLVFNDVHLWAVIFSVIVINYIFQDGKTDYFQGVVLCAIYIILLCMYYFTPTPEAAKC